MDGFLVLALNTRMGEVREVLETIRAVCTVEAITVESHERGLAVLERYGFSLYDSQLVASALLSGAKTLYSEDLQHGQIIDKKLLVVNPLWSGLNHFNLALLFGNACAS